MRLQLVAAALAALAARADGAEALDGIELVVECLASSADGFDSYRCGARINRALTTSWKLQLARSQPPGSFSVRAVGCGQHRLYNRRNDPCSYFLAEISRPSTKGGWQRQKCPQSEC